MGELINEFSAILVGCSSSKQNSKPSDKKQEVSTKSKVATNGIRNKTPAIFPNYTWEEKNEMATLIVRGEPIKIVDEYEADGGQFT